MEVGTGKYIFIDTDAGLKQASAVFLNEKIAACDTEANSMYTYSEKTCLIQLTANHSDFIIDPFLIKDLSPLGELFENPDIEKVFHAAEYDIICLARDYGFSFCNLFDTMTAAKILRMEKIGLGDIIEAEFNIKLSKKLQRADWGKRPLTEDMLDYARMDTHFLIPLRDRYKHLLEQSDFMELAEEEFKAVCRTSSAPFFSLEESFLRTKKLKTLETRQKSALWQLYILRDNEAKLRDKPHYKVLSEELLFNIAYGRPETKEDLARIPGMTPYNLNKYAFHILECVLASSSSGYPEQEKKIQLDEDYYIRLDKLKKWRTQTAHNINLSSELILPRGLMHQIALENPKTEEELKNIMSEFPYRYIEHKSSILEIIAN